MKEIAAFAVIAFVITLLAVTQCGVETRVRALEGKVNALQELQQEKLNAFSKDVYNMTGVMELLEKQALLLQEIERRTR